MFNRFAVSKSLHSAHRSLPAALYAGPEPRYNEDGAWDSGERPIRYEEERDMSATISIDVPRELLHAARMTTEEIKQELAIHLFERGRLSFGKAREMTGMTVATFQQLLGSRGICVHYDMNEYDEDLATLKAQGRL